MNSDITFDQLRELYILKNLHDCHNTFIKDGIINPTKYFSQHTKILFIAKEHNYLGNFDDKDYGSDYRLWWNDHVKFQFSHRISEWSYGILNNFDTNCLELTYDQKHEALRSIAFINVKKASGNHVANPEVICNYIANSRDLLHRQINDISPTLIICCFRYDFYIEQLFGVNLTWTTSTGFGYGKWDGIDIINFHHPSSRKNKQLLYSLMREAVEQVKASQLKSFS